MVPNELLKGKDRRINCFFFIIRSIHKAEHPPGCLTEPFICYFAVISDLSTCTRTIMPFEPDGLSSEGCRLSLKLILFNSESFLESPIKISRLSKKRDDHLRPLLITPKNNLNFHNFMQKTQLALLISSATPPKNTSWAM